MGFAEIMEIVFNIAYLITIWTLVAKMIRRKRNVPVSDGPVAQRLLTGFFLLALGDTGHVGFRVWAYALGGLNSKVTIGGLTIPLVGIGALCTAYTVTVLYMLIVDAWRIRFKKKAGLLYFLIQAVAAARLIIMLFPQNQWSAVVPPFAWSMYRNMPLTFVGISIAVLMLFEANKAGDKTFKSFAMYIFASYLFYLPVILFVDVAPMVGMLMIPKTIAYILMAIASYKSFFKKPISVLK